MYPTNTSSKFSPMRPPSPTAFVNFSPPTDYPSSSSGMSGSSTSSANQSAALLGGGGVNSTQIISNSKQHKQHLNASKASPSANMMVGIHNYIHNGSSNLTSDHHHHMQPQQQFYNMPASSDMLEHSMLISAAAKQNLHHMTKNKVNHNNNNTIMPNAGGFIDTRLMQSVGVAGNGVGSEFFYQDDVDQIEFCRPDTLIMNGDGTSPSNQINSKTLGGSSFVAASSCPGSSFTERRRRSHSRRSNHKMEVEQQVKWTRKNIAATMERFEPTKADYGATSSTPPLQPTQSIQLQLQNSHNHEQHNPMNHVYSYAYYEPGAAKCHTNIPPRDFNHKPLVGSSPNQISTASIASTSSSSSSVGLGGGSSGGAGSGGSSNTSPFAVNMGASTSSGVRNAVVAGPSKSPPRNSIRALLAKSFRSKTLGNKSFDSSSHHNTHHSQSPIHNMDERHNYTTRYGTTENLYEEVNDQKIRKVLSDNRIVSLNSPTVKEELRRVQHNHFRVLDELNLSLEALIMPPTPPDISPTVEEKVSHASSMENLSSTLNSIELKDHTCINPEFDEGDLDSGFSGSGSSSGASYNESLRYYKSGGSGVMQTTTLPHNVRSCRNSTASGTSTSKSSMNSEDQGIGLTMPPTSNGSGSCIQQPAMNGGGSPFSFVRRCSDTQRSAVSAAGGAATISGTKPKKNFWTIKQ